MDKELRIIISGGGTGGHIFPAVSIANALRQMRPEAKILFPDFVTFLEQAYKCLIINTLIYTLGDAEK